MNNREITNRLDAVEILSFTCPPVLRKFYEAIVSIKQDLERSLCRIHYSKCSPIEFLNFLKNFATIYSQLPKLDDLSELSSAYLKKLIQDIPNQSKLVGSFLSKISEDAAISADLVNLFVNENDYPDSKKLKKEITLVKEDLQKYLNELKKTMKNPNLSYVSKMNLDYLIEVKKTEKNVPRDWIPIAR